jgi:hypothetical protein
VPSDETMFGMAEDHLPDEAIVVRGGMMGSPSLRSNAGVSSAELGIWAISVWAYPEQTAEEVAEEARRVDEVALPQGKLRFSMAGRIRSAGYDLIATNQRGHYSLVVPAEPTEAVWDDLRSIFDETCRNPVAR